MNTIDDKAKELVEKFMPYSLNFFTSQPELRKAKEQALICVDEIQTAITAYSNDNNHSIEDAQIEFSYWQKVKEKIQSL